MLLVHALIILHETCVLYISIVNLLYDLLENLLADDLWQESMGGLLISRELLENASLVDSLEQAKSDWFQAATAAAGITGGWKRRGGGAAAASSMKKMVFYFAISLSPLNGLKEKQKRCVNRPFTLFVPSALSLTESLKVNLKK